MGPPIHSMIRRYFCTTPQRCRAENNPTSPNPPPTHPPHHHHHRHLSTLQSSIPIQLAHTQPNNQARGFNYPVVEKQQPWTPVVVVASDPRLAAGTVAQAPPSRVRSPPRRGGAPPLRGGAAASAVRVGGQRTAQQDIQDTTTTTTLRGNEGLLSFWPGCSYSERDKTWLLTKHQAVRTAITPSFSEAFVRAFLLWSERRRRSGEARRVRSSERSEARSERRRRRRADSTAAATVAMEAFNKLPKIPVSELVVRWKKMPKERVMKMEKIENVRFKDHTGQVMHYRDVISGVSGRCYPPKAFEHHLELHHKGAGVEEVLFCIREDIPPGEIDFEIRFKPI